MNTTDLVPYTAGERPPAAPVRPARPPQYHELVAPLRLAILRARQFLSSARLGDGLWTGESFGDPSLTAQLVLLLAYLGDADSELATRAAATLLDQQLSGGGWSLTPHGPPDLSTSVQAYFAIKVSGHDPSDEKLTKARAMIRKLGGADASDAPTRFLLAIFGQIPYDCCPAFVQQALFVRKPRHPALAALFVLSARRPCCHLDINLGVRELFLRKPADWPAPSMDDQWKPFPRRAAWVHAFLRRWQERGGSPLRARALRNAEASLREILDAQSLTTLRFQDLAFTIIALHALEEGADSPAAKACRSRLQQLLVFDDPERLHPRPRTTPLADSALALRSIEASGASFRLRFGHNASAWLAQVQMLAPSVDPVETAWLIDVLQQVAASSPEARTSLPPDIQLDSDEFRPLTTVGEAALRRRALNLAGRLADQLASHQNHDGGWGPALGSTSSADVTAIVLETLASRDRARYPRAIDRAIDYLRTQQRADGSWSSATGVRLVHGTSLAVRGLIAAGMTTESEVVAAGVNWLLVNQRSIGGWGESPQHEPDCTRDEVVSGPATASQTAWALLALVAAGRALDGPARRAVQFLLDTQEEDGGWHEPHFVLHDPATRRWYRNELHATAWPLLALSRWAVVAAAEAEQEAAAGPSLKVFGCAPSPG
jgi:squalene-hopene/tetraprenyl-beta-curcumene cyclase